MAQISKNKRKLARIRRKNTLLHRRVQTLTQIAEHFYEQSQKGPDTSPGQQIPAPEPTDGQ